ncbi:zinc finger BED domain-containing protein 6-like [Dendropsophus ebraccatus]|uniref:zinc finger BED domain-containing protein 6-like n=1 Tax=Dendropsophus ebraccatus TaxID=150705 RepID=UPI003831936D
MESRRSKDQNAEHTRITPEMLKSRTGEIDLESILSLKLRGVGLQELGCIGECLNLERLDLSNNHITHLDPLSSLKQMVALNLSCNWISSLEPLASCDNLQTLNVAGNLLCSIENLQCLKGLRRLESIRLRDPVSNLSNPLCANGSYRHAVLDAIPSLQVIDGETVTGSGSDLYQVCNDVDNSLTKCNGSGAVEVSGAVIPSGPATVPRSTPSRQAPVQRGRSSLVWHFFEESANDKRIVFCSLCGAKISRGVTTTSLTTTSMLRHMSSKHPTRWNEGRALQSAPAGDTTASFPVLGAGTAVHSPAQDAGMFASNPSPAPDAGLACAPLPAGSSTMSSNVSLRSVQLSVPQVFERKRKYAATHPHAQVLNVKIAKLLTQEMLPYGLVETEAFRSLMETAVPRYSVPSRHYFSRCAIPALHQNVTHNITRALTNAVTGKVHLTTDTWTSGQRRYISLTAHWVNIVEDGTESYPGSPHILPTPRTAGPTSVRASPTYYATSSNPSSSTSELTSGSTPPSVGSWKRCSTAVGKHQQAVLKLLNLGDKNYTAAELLTDVTKQTNLWLSPMNLQPGMVVSDNGRKLVAALQLGKLPHVPCLAHVFNLVVQRFLKTYPDLPELLVKVRRVCAHLRKSTTNGAIFKTLQQRLHLPAHRLLCDMTTCWNSTFHVLTRVCEQKTAILEYQLQHARRVASQLPHFSNEEWTWMANICEVLRNFEESTQMVSGDAAIISVTIPLLCLLKRSLLNIKADALHGKKEVEEDGTPIDSQNTLISISQHVLDEEEEDDEEEERETIAFTAEDSSHGSCIPSFQRGWPEEEEEGEKMESPSPSEDSEVLPVRSLAHMADFMLDCLSRDPRFIRILANTDYWLFTLLDPRYKENFTSLIPEEERSTRVMQYHQALVEKLIQYFPSDNDSSRGLSCVGQRRRDMRGTGSMSNTGRGVLSKVWDMFMTSPQEYSTIAQPRITRREKFWKMVMEYVADHTIVLRDPSAPFNYWVSKLDTWHELALYALEVLACPAASVLSERVFNTAGGIITEKRTHLAPENDDRLMLIKMNKAWISPDFTSPLVESSVP